RTLSDRRLYCILIGNLRGRLRNLNSRFFIQAEHGCVFGELLNTQITVVISVGIKSQVVSHIIEEFVTGYLKCTYNVQASMAASVPAARARSHIGEDSVTVKCSIPVNDPFRKPCHR